MCVCESFYAAHKPLAGGVHEDCIYPDAIASHHVESIVLPRSSLWVTGSSHVHMGENGC